MYRELDPKLIVATTETLSKRIAERFPGSGLLDVSQDLLALASATEPRIERLRRPDWVIRTLAGFGVLLIVAVVFAGVMAIRVRAGTAGWSDLLQGLEAAVNDVIFASVAVYFLFTTEGRLKRRLALRALHELRSVAHIVDMHQLTKDPEQVMSAPRPTASSPRRSMDRFELARYLDYCSEALSLTSKLAALHVQYFNDPVVLDAVNDVQTLAQGLSVKIWQKIMILDSVAARSAGGATA